MDTPFINSKEHAVSTHLSQSVIAGRLLATAVACTSFAAAANPAAQEPEAVLLSEPLWILQDPPNAPRGIWFARQDGRLVMVSCAGSGKCAYPVSLQPGGFTMVDGDGFTTSWRLSADNYRSFRRDDLKAELVPDWVVPAQGSLTGH